MGDFLEELFEIEGLVVCTLLVVTPLTGLLVRTWIQAIICRIELTLVDFSHDGELFISRAGAMTGFTLNAVFNLEGRSNQTFVNAVGGGVALEAFG